MNRERVDGYSSISIGSKGYVMNTDIKLDVEAAKKVLLSGIDELIADLA